MESRGRHIEDVQSEIVQQELSVIISINKSEKLFKCSKLP